MKENIVTVNNINIFYREAGSNDKPNLILFHGFPSSSFMYRDLIPLLENKFHIIAPDYPGFGESQSPSREEFKYTFNNIANLMDAFLEELKIDKFYMYVFDYGAPIGFRVALKHPEKILGIISQNGNVYEEGLGKKWEARKEYWKNPSKELREQYKSAFSRDVVIGQYTFGTPQESVNSDGYEKDLYFANTIPDYDEKQSDLIFDYQTNVALYSAFQEYLRKYQPKLLAVWGKNDPSFIYEGALAFKKDLPNATIVPIDSGHFALESHAKEIAKEIIKWL